MSSEEDNEAKIPLDEIIKKLADQIEKLTDIMKAAQKQTKANTNANADWHKYQAMMKIEQEKEHGRQVRLNKEYGRSQASLQMFTGLLTRGATASFAFNKLAQHIGGVSKELDKYKAEHKELIRMQEDYRKKGIDILRGDLSKPENRAERDAFRKQQERVDEAKDKQKGSGKLAEGISSMKAFAEKHKTGILIGAGSIGILLTVLKKAFDVSPMFQAIKKLLHFGFMLILRPIGDFFGFIMRPIMVLMLRKFIIPWYKDVYPKMKKWGEKLGGAATDFIDTVSDPVTIVTGLLATAGIVTAIAVVAKKLTVSLASSVVKNSLINAGVNVPKVVTPPKPNLINQIPNRGLNIPQAATPAQKPIQLVQKNANVIQNAAKVLQNPQKLVNNIVAKVSNPVKNAMTSVGNVMKSAGSKLGSVTKNLNMGKLTGKLTKGGGLIGLAMVAEGMVASPETLGGLIDEESDWRLDKLFNNALGTGLSEDSEGNFKSIGYGDELAAAMGDESYKHGIIAKLYGGSATGVGGGAGDVRGGRGTGVVINIANVSKEVDVQSIGAVVSSELQKQNKRSHKF